MMSIQFPVKKVSVKEFADLPVEEQLLQLRGVDARQKSRYLLAADNGEELMAALPEQSVYLMIKELGVEQLPELLHLAGGEQWTTFLDLDCWSGEQFTPGRARTWLSLLLGDDDEQVVRKLKTMNFETLLLVLKSELEVLAGPESFDDEDARMEAMKRDGGYQLQYRDEDSAKLYGVLLDTLFRVDPDFFRYLLESVRAETLSLVAESVYQQRGLRLQDLGFPEPWRARDIYAWADPEAFRAAKSAKVSLGLADQGVAPGFPLALVAPEGVFASLLAEGVDDAVAWELTALVNKVLIADSLDVGSVDDVSLAVEKINSQLNLALEWLVGKNLADARQALEDYYLEELFRLGYSLIMQLQREARRLAQSAVGPYLEPRYRSCINALLQQQPQFFAGLLDPLRDELQMFAHVAELDAARAALEQVDVQDQLFEKVFDFQLPQPVEIDLTTCYKSIPEELTLADFFLTALANRLLGRPFEPVPLPEEELAGLHGLVSEQGRVKPALRAETCAWLEQQIPGSGVFGDLCLDVWGEEFCAVRYDALDPRFVNGLIIRQAEEGEDG